MKAKREHRVPLSDAAWEILESLRGLHDTPYIFPGSRLTSLSDATLSKVLKDLKIQAVPHGFRSTFKDWAVECTNYPSEMSEMALAHVVADKVEAAYRRGDMLERRRQMMDDWARFCQQEWSTGTVVPISSAGARAAA